MNERIRAVAPYRDCRRPAGLDVACAGFTGINQIRPAPCEGRLSELAGKQVAGETRQAPIAIGERMDRNEAMAEPHGDVVRWISAVLDPISRIIDRLPNLHGDPVARRRFARTCGARGRRRLSPVGPRECRRSLYPAERRCGACDRRRGSIAPCDPQRGQDMINDAGQEINRRQLNVAPTLTIRPGFPVRVIVTRDLVLEPYGA